MSVTVRHLNGDSTFLLIFSAQPNPTPSDLRTVNGAYSVLIDPWIAGSSVTAAPWFAVTHRVERSLIEHLSQLADEPDVVVCSQNKTDHTNKETLLQLRPEAKTLIVAEPAAAKTIKSWNHFNPTRIRSMGRYDAKSRCDNVLRLTVPPLTAEGDPGLITIAFIPARNYVTGLHNAFGITYQPPTRSRALTSPTTIDLSTSYLAQQSAANLLHPHPSPTYNPVFENLSGHTIIDDDNRSITSHASQLPKDGINVAALPQTYPVILTPPADPDDVIDFDKAAFDSSFFNFAEHIKPEPFALSPSILTPPASPGSLAVTRTSSFSTLSSLKPNSGNQYEKDTTCPVNTIKVEKAIVQTNKSKTISIVYSPHGLPLNDLQPYIRNHLLRLPGALPLTLLLHSFDHTANPWYLGGNITTGAEGGMEIAQAVMAQCWISAHDAEKDKQGLAIKLLKMKKTDISEVQHQMQTSHNGKPQSWICDIRNLQIGQEVSLSHSALPKQRPGSSHDKIYKHMGSTGAAVPVMPT